MNEQRPPTSPAYSSTAQPPRTNPPPHAPHASHAPHAARPPQAPPPIQQQAPRPVMRASPAQSSTSSLPMDDDDLVVLEDAISLEDDGEVTAPPPRPIAAAAGVQSKAAAAEAPAPKKITFGAENMVRTHQWKRKPHLGGQGACRVKTFHGKLSDQGLEYLDEAINVFLDEHPEIEVKFVQSNVGMFDGKFKDFALVVNVWY